VGEVGKVRTNLTIDKDVLKTAMEIGINVGQFCENALREAIEKLKSPRTEPNGGSASFSLSSGSLFGKRESEVGRTGLEPATFCTSSRCPNRARLPAP
jgi:post-segregation antitoxin (ccd killing protein)